MDERTTESVPACALRFAGTCELGDNSDGATTAPFRMVARSGDPIDHWYWGRVVHDLDGMHLSRSRVAIDYEHDPKEIIGYANQFHIESGDLEVRGALVKTRSSNRAMDVIDLAKAGVPFEASISFGGDGIEIERVPDARDVEINGRQLSGPLTVIRKWPLRGIAVTPYGADSNTSTQFSADELIPVTVCTVCEDQDMSEITAMTEAFEKIEDAVDVADHDSAEAVETPAVEAPEEQPAELAETQPVSDRATEGARFIEAFGDEYGPKYFARGVSFEDATVAELKRQREEIAELKKRLHSQQTEGEDGPVTFSDVSTPEQLASLPIRMPSGR